jgi:hypothetical protein
MRGFRALTAVSAAIFEGCCAVLLGFTSCESAAEGCGEELVDGFAQRCFVGCEGCCDVALELASHGGGAGDGGGEFRAHGAVGAGFSKSKPPLISKAASAVSMAVTR